MKGFCLTVACLTCAAAGCSSPSCVTSTGWRFEVMKPPTISVSTPILVQGGSSMVSAHPIGTVAGPVTDGQFTQGPALTPSIVTTQAPVRVTPRMVQPAGCTPSQPAEKIPPPRMAPAPHCEE